MANLKLKSDIPYLLSWFCWIFPLLGILTALEYFVRGSRRMTFQTLVCGWWPWIFFIGVITLFPKAEGALVLVLVLPVITLYFLRRLGWPTPTPLKTGPWVSVVIFLVIMGILIAIATPVYQMMAIKGKAGAAGDEAIQRVEQYVRANHKLPATNADIGSPAGAGNKYIESLSVGANGVITVRLSALVETGGVFNESVAGKIVILTPHLNAGVVTWSCVGGTLPDKYRSRYYCQKSSGQLY